MELIYANHDREDVGILKNPDLDLAFGGDENNFECTVGIEDHCCEDGFYIYAEGTEYGGIVDAIKIDSADDTVTYSGRTWHGMLASKMIEPLKNGEETGGGGGGTASRLPEGYTEVEYIKSSGSQYIDTGFVPNQDTRVVCDAVFSPEGTSSQYFFGVRVSSTSRQFGLRGTSSGYQIKYGNVDGGTTSGVEAGRILIDFNKNKLSVGSLSLSNDYATFTCPGNMYLFAANNNGAVYANCTATVYSMQIYDNGVLVRDFIPCKNASGVAGLYDVVGGKFYGNAGSGSFAAGDEVVPIVLPKGFKLLESIESTGTQYIDTAYVPNANTKAALTFQLTKPDTSNQAVFGVAGQFSFRWYGTNGCFRTNGSNNVDFAKTIDSSAKHTVVKTATQTTIDDAYTATTTAGSVSLSLYLFGQHITTGVQNAASVRVFRFKISENDVLKRDFVPCENASGAVGLYDLVESKFYGNSGSGVFIAGAEIETPTVDEPAVVVVEAEDDDGKSYVDKYLVISGDANGCIKYILDRINLAPLFVAVEDAAGVNVEKHRFDPYLDAYTGLCEMLEKVGLRLRMECFDGVVTLSAVPIFDFSADQEMESDLIEYQMTKKYRKVNHLICIGYSGTIVHLYVDEEGHISEEQTFVGVEEYTAVNGQKSEDEENSGASTGTDERADLIANGKKVLAGMLKANTITVQFEPTDDTYYVGDIVGAYDRTTDISVSARVNKKILSLVNGRAEIEYKVGD